MSNYNISFDSYKIFCTVAKYKSITRASEELYVTQPSISMSIKALEEKLGCTLFTRSQKGVKLTREGEVFYYYLSKAIELIDTAEKKYEELLHLDAGEITISASDSIISGYLLPYLEKYNENYNMVNMKVINRTSDETVDLLKKCKIDIGFVNLPIKVDESIEIIECMPLHDCVVFGKKYKHLLDRDFSVMAIENYPCLMLKHSSNTRLLLDKYLKQQGLEINPLIELDSTNLLLEFARINLGVAFVIKEFTEKLVDNEALFQVTLSPPIENRGLGMIKLKNIPQSHAAKAFMDLILSDIKYLTHK